MTETHQYLSDITIMGPDTRHEGVRVGSDEPRPWLTDFAVCPALGQHQIVHVGLASSVKPFRIVRRNQTSSYFLACFGGEGRVWVDGEWRQCAPGMGCLLPPHTMEAFHAVGTVPWEYCWVCYLQPEAQQPLVSASSPVLAAFNPTPLRHAIEGLLAECRGTNDPAAAFHWIELIHRYVLQFTRPWKADDRLFHLWRRVALDLGAPWTVEMLARDAHCSPEHLRRLCHRELGRSPMRHVMQLRLRHAAELLISTDDKIETIAQRIGYQNPFVFSTTFKKWFGASPSEYRLRRDKG